MQGRSTTDTTKLADIFNTYYINIVQRLSVTPPSIKENPENLLEDSLIIQI